MKKENLKKTGNKRFWLWIIIAFIIGCASGFVADYFIASLPVKKATAIGRIVNKNGEIWVVLDDEENGLVSIK